MFIWNKTGTRLLKTEDILEIRLADETSLMREQHPATNVNVFVLRAYYKLNDEKESKVLATYESFEEAQNYFSLLIQALGQGVPVFSFFDGSASLTDGKDEPEESIGL